jgi:hypothetical protein
MAATPCLREATPYPRQSSIRLRPFCILAVSEEHMIRDGDTTRFFIDESIAARRSIPLHAARPVGTIPGSRRSGQVFG